MPEPAYQASGHRVFIDFDNTISRGDVLDGLIERFAEGGAWRELEAEWAAGRIGARACLDGQLRSMRGTWPEFVAHLGSVELDPGFGRLRGVLREARVELVILSDNFDLFVGELLLRHGHADVRYVANHVEFAGDRLIPSFPHYNPGCPGCAHCKKTHFVPRRDRMRVVYIGDGASDICPARHADIVFAKSSLLGYLKGAGLPCRPFGDLAGVAEELGRIIHENKP